VADNEGLHGGHDPSTGAPASPPPGSRPLRSADRVVMSGTVPHEIWEREGLWSALFEQAPMPYALYELGTGRVMGNRMCTEMFGYEHHPLAWFPLETVGGPLDRTRTDLLIDQMLQDGMGVVEFDKQYERADGSAFDGHVRASVMRDEHGEAWGILLAIEDVTERRAAEKALAASESRWRALVAKSHDAIIVVDASGQLTYASPSGDRLMGEAVDPYLNQEVFQWCHPDDRTVAAEVFASALANPGGVTGPLRLRMCRPDGTVKPVEALATNLLDDPAVQGIVVNIRDLTDTEEAVSALEVTESRYRCMLENIDDTVTLVSPEGRVVLTTGNLKPVLGYPQDFWAGLDVFELVHPDEVEETRNNFYKVLRRPGSHYQGEIRVKVPGGGFRDLEINAVNLMDTTVEALVITSRDVTDRNTIQREIAEARDQAVQALRERTEFIANVSHELRTPIHGILGLSELLEERADLDDETRELARNVARATDTLRMVLDDILDFSKIEVGRLATTDEPFNVKQMHADLDSLFDQQAAAKGIRLTAHIEPGFPEAVRGDALRIRQVLQNLISNAIKFTHEGEVKVSVARLGSRPPMCRISVADTGIGIPPEAHERLFEPFSQGFTNSSEFGGTGLGLAIARRLVELMGGELCFTSEVGKGSEFWFTLPLVEAAPEPFTADDRPDPVGAGNGLRVLVVEDNAINQLLVRRQLARLGYEAVLVASGDLALEAFPKVEADLVLMDWQLPGIDGLETTRQIREWERANRRPRTPVVAMTASALPGDRDRCLSAGMDDFIAKPVSIGTLDATCRRWVEVSTTRAADELVLDPHALDVLNEELDDSALVATVVRTFLRELPGRVEWILEAGANGDLRGLTLMTHTLRSTSMAVGARGLVTVCEQLEQAARDHPEDGSKWDVAPLEAMAQQVSDALARHVNRPSSNGDDSPAETRVGGAQPSMR
jgi:PAS domain S-box-containing protein